MSYLDIPIGFGAALSVSTMTLDAEQPGYWLTVGPVSTIDAEVRVTRGVAVTVGGRGFAFYCLPPGWACS